jgi:hypothetical protein
VTTILDDARIVSGHAKKKIVDVDDVKLAVQVKYFTNGATTFIRMSVVGVKIIIFHGRLG